jgi:murein DD-endopeptidase MepM/ murein hydrolase activator NlpD
MGFPTFIKPLVGRAVVKSGWGSDRTGVSGRPEGVSAIHNGIDIAASVGTPVLAAATGKVVTVADWGDSGGKAVVVEHPYGVRSRYLHLSKFAVGVGQQVSQGQQIAWSGDTGVASSNPHLHFDLRVPNGYVQLYRNLYGTPRGVEFPGDFASGGYGIPSEPFIPVDDYVDSVKARAASYGIPLHKSNWVAWAFIGAFGLAAWLATRRMR